ncbi:MAG: hypothetical protein A3K19_16320 [Lentisphaerae bacterium RIFOXYB12_FULL_65_16]|nr:MAG: hypothetical protein A3K18_32750 [Lentisphaerae bacterium RIFOXYA12_64_32]OGV89079.1 MAG: hypothetical protein A3K19_16320 [Lentisphaerae bacterium RIFOXYB12_FULL_65_16]
MEDIPPRQAATSLFRHLDALAPDVVMAGAVAFPSGAAALRWACARKRGVILFDDARREDVPRSMLVNGVKRRLYSHASAVVVPAPSHDPTYLSWGVPQAAIFHGLIAIDNDGFATAVRSMQGQAPELRQALGLPPRFLLGVGRQVPKKNWAGLLQAWAGFCAAEPDAAAGCHLVLVGDGPERTRLELLTAELRLHNVVFRPFVAQEELCKYYRLASGLVLPSFHGESWGRVVNEAMACGLPVLVSRECGCAQTLVRLENGWVFDPHDTQAITAALRDWSSCAPQELKGMGAQSRAIVGEWGPDRFCRGVCDAIDYASSRPANYRSILDRILIGLWNGRYRPT